MNKKNLIIVILASSLILTVNFFVLDKWLDLRENELSKFYQQGYDRGLEDAVTTIFEQTENCQLASIWIGNSSKDLIDFLCI